MLYNQNGKINQGFETKPSATPVLTVAGAYASGDYVGTSLSPMIFEGCAAIPGGAGWVLGATLVDGDNQKVAGELWLFTNPITPPADNAAWTLADAILAANFLCVIPFATYYATAVNAISQGRPDSSYARYIANEERRLYGVLVTRGAPTYTSGALAVFLNLEQR